MRDPRRMDACRSRTCLIRERDARPHAIFVSTSAPTRARRRSGVFAREGDERPPASIPGRWVRTSDAGWAARSSYGKVYVTLALQNALVAGRVVNSRKYESVSVTVKTADPEAKPETNPEPDPPVISSRLGL